MSSILSFIVLANLISVKNLNRKLRFFLFANKKHDSKAYSYKTILVQFEILKIIRLLKT